jgi:myo-inositol 2-dehydrogenase/D-chiro-inositol 1-dehydrogenase
MLRFAQFGAGRIGAIHAGNLASTPDTQLLHIVDVNPEAACALAEKHGAQVSGVEAALADPRVDAVIIASSTDTHADLAIAAAKAGKAIFCEKPIDLSLKRVDACLAAVKKAKVPMFVGFNRRFDPSFAALHARIARGDIGAVEQVIISSRDPGLPPISYLKVSGGQFRDMTIHDFDMGRFFVPNIVSVTANGFNQFSSEIKELGDYDATSVTLRGANDELVLITNSRHAVYGFDQRMEAFGDKGMLRVENLTNTNVRLYNESSAEVKEPYQNFFLERYMDSYLLELAEFMKKVRGEASNSPEFEDGRAALVLANAALESSQTGKTVSVSL